MEGNKDWMLGKKLINFLFWGEFLGILRYHSIEFFVFNELTDNVYSAYELARQEYLWESGPR
jgi:hypothetical protein